MGKDVRLSRREFLQRVAAVGLGAAAMGVAGGCTPAAPPVGVGATATPAPAAKKKVSLVYWAEPRFQYVKGKEEQTQEVGDYERLLAQEFMDQNPHVTIEAEALAWEDLVTKVAAAIAAGQPPDLLKDYLGRTASYAYQGLLEPLEGAIPKDEYDDFLPSVREQYTIEGHLHGLPVYFWVTHMWGNAAIFAEANATDKLPDEKGTWTIPGFESALKALAIPDKRWPLALQVASEQGDYNVLGFFWAAGAKLYEGGDYSKTAFNSPAAVETLTRLVEWYNAGYIVPGVTTISGADLNNMLFRGEAVVAGGGLGSLPLLKAAQKEGRVTVEWDPFFSLFPHAEGVKSGGLAAGPTGVVVFQQKDADKRAAAVDFARFLAAPEKQMEYAINSNQFPTRKSVGNPFEGKKEFTRVLEWIKTYGVEDMGLSSPAYYEVRVQLPPQLQAAFLGEKTPEQALADYEKVVNEILARYAG